MDLSEITTNPNRHPWEMSRSDFLMNVMERYVQLDSNSELLDVGAGDLFFSHKVHRATAVKIDAVDNAFEEEGPRAEAIQRIKYLDSVLHKRYNAICALDVLEHVENDREFLNTLLHMLKPGASLLLSVPAFNFLFTQHDTNLRHFRRYRKSEVARLIDQPEDFEVKEGFYFFHSLFFVRAFEKMKESMGFKPKSEDSFKSINQWKFTEHHPITRSLGGFLTLDALFCRALSRLKMKVPGLSLCMVIQRTSK